MLLINAQNGNSQASYSKNQIGVESAAVTFCACGEGPFCSAGAAGVFCFLLPRVQGGFVLLIFFLATTRPGFFPGFAVLICEVVCFDTSVIGGATSEKASAFSSMLYIIM